MNPLALGLGIAGAAIFMLALLTRRPGPYGSVPRTYKRKAKKAS